LVLFASTLLAKNVYQAGFKPQLSEEKVMTLSRFMVLVIMTFALVFAIFFPNELVPLLIFGYNGVSQFFPGVTLGLFWRRVTRLGVLCGLISGVTVVLILILSKNDPFLSMNAGFVGLAVNSFVTIGVSLMTKPTEGGFK
jgi:SSS family solute:Na+ symporter